MNLTRLMASFYLTPWAIADSFLEMIKTELVAAHDTNDEERLERLNGRITKSQVNGAVAVIPIQGAIGHRSNFISEYFGWPTTEKLGEMLDDAMENKAIGAIVFDINSPGGLAVGNQELHDKMMSYRGKKPMVAVANGMAASAAYYIASAADEFVVTPSGEVGSIGTVMVHADMSKYYEEAGIKTTVIKAGKYKWEGNPYAPLTEETLEELQKGVDAHYDMFVNAVAAGRGVSAAKVKKDFGQGRMVMAEEAKSKGMVDRVDTLENVLARLSGTKSPTKKGVRSEVYALITQGLAL